MCYASSMNFVECNSMFCTVCSSSWSLFTFPDSFNITNEESVAQKSLKTCLTYRVGKHIYKYVSDNGLVSRVYKLVTAQ